jgi:hypothetical protein
MSVQKCKSAYGLCKGAKVSDKRQGSRGAGDRKACFGLDVITKVVTLSLWQKSSKFAASVTLSE